MRTALVPALLGLALLSGCHRHKETDEPPPPPPKVQTPVDTTLPGELAEGKEQAFGVALPRVMKVNGRFADTVTASGPASPEQVANFFRRRLKADKVETGPTKTVLTKARPDATIVIEVSGRSGLATVSVRSVPQPKPDDSSTPAERMRRAGFNPDGSLADPTHLH